MKKRIICLLAALLLLLGLSVSASAAVYANVIDTAELLSESEAEALDARCSELEQTYGCGVKEYLRTLRIRRAAELLVTTELTNSEICQQIGIADYNYFFRVFREQTGLTPQMYRRQLSGRW